MQIQTSIKRETPQMPQITVEEITIGNTTYTVTTNAKSVPKAYVKKKVEKLLVDALNQKS